jgi:hypothetical protein
MRKPNPLSEILESSMLQSEPMMDTEWPAAEVVLTETRPTETHRPAYAPRLIPAPR